jgi:hypothetical protein
MMKSRWGQILASSRASRAAYGIIKCAAFFVMGAYLALNDFPQVRAALSTGAMRAFYFGAIALAGASVAFCIVRGVPVIVEECDSSPRVSRYRSLGAWANEGWKNRRDL